MKKDNRMAGKKKKSLFVQALRNISPLLPPREITSKALKCAMKMKTSG
jgi:hypothetical protein